MCAHLNTRPFLERNSFQPLSGAESASWLARDAIRAGSNEDITVVVRAETGPVLQAKLKLEINRLDQDNL